MRSLVEAALEAQTFDMTMRCAWCGKAFTQKCKGRPRLCCTDVCHKARWADYIYRRRHGWRRPTKHVDLSRASADLRWCAGGEAQP